MKLMMGTSKLSGHKILAGISINAFEQTSGPLLPDGFDVATASPLDYFELLFKPRIFKEIKTYMNNYALFHGDQKQIAKNDPNYEDPKWTETTVEELKALFGVTILMGISKLPQVQLYWDSNQFIGNTGIKKAMT